jgi:broad specificity phosphatase PhoE
MGVLLLIRHGQACLGVADYDRLSEIGQHQARQTGNRLAHTDLNIARVVCGAMHRQRDTALAIMAELGLPESQLRTEDRLDEYDHAGVLAEHDSSPISFETATTAQSRRALQSALDEAIVRWMAADTGYSETHDAFVTRVLGVMGDLAGSPGGTLAVTSGGVIAAMTAHVLGLPVDGWPALARTMVNASITKIITGKAGTHLLSFNDHAHLEQSRHLITYR